MSTHHLLLPPARVTGHGRWVRGGAAARRRTAIRRVNTVVIAAMLGTTGLAGGTLVYQLWWTNVTATAAHATTVEDLRVAFSEKRSADAFEQARVLELATTSAEALSGLGAFSYDPDPAAVEQDVRERLEATLFEPGVPLGVVHIPRFGDGFAAPMVVGVQDETLQGGIGWNPEGARPGETGNLGLAGHRSSWGQPLNQVAELLPGDPVIVETASGWYTYTVVGHEIVAPTSTEVWAQVPRRPEEHATSAWATLVACHPIGSDDQRWITYAQLSEFTDRGQGPPEALTGH